MKNLFKKNPVKPEWHNLRSTSPISRVFGFDRGTPIDRFYIEDFLSKNTNLITGTTLEIGDNFYSKKFGIDVTSYEVLHKMPDTRVVTIVGDLTNTKTLPASKIDCFLCTQKLNFIYDFKNAILGGWHVLKENGVMLATVAGISQISEYDMKRWGDYWRFTTLSIKKAFEEVFGEKNVEVDFYGNVLSSVAFLEGISAEELKTEELMFKDENYQLIIVVKATKA